MAYSDDLTYTRTVNGGTPELISARTAFGEINAGMMRPTNKNVRTMSASGQGRSLRASIAYRDGRTVTIRHATAAELAERVAEHTADGRRVVTVNGKRYIIGAVTPARPRTPGAIMWNDKAYVNYWTERDGRVFGATRSASERSRPGTVGAAIWAAAN